MWDNDDPQAALAEMVGDWNLLDPSYDSRTPGDDEWILATGVDGWADGSVIVVIAVTRIGDTTLGFVLLTDAEEMEQLVDSVLIQSLEAATVDS